MQTVLYNGSRTIAVDTEDDMCLFAAARPMKPSQAYQRQGKDLYIHTDQEKNTYYLHIWESNGAIRDKIVQISPTAADQFLRSKGLICDLFPKSDPVSTLYQWGYGIAEEF